MPDARFRTRAISQSRNSLLPRHHDLPYRDPPRSGIGKGVALDGLPQDPVEQVVVGGVRRIEVEEHRLLRGGAVLRVHFVEGCLRDDRLVRRQFRVLLKDLPERPAEVVELGERFEVLQMSASVFDLSNRGDVAYVASRLKGIVPKP